jgi:TatD DNase family protein
MSAGRAPVWIDTHCHLDASEFDADRLTVREHARQLGVGLCVLPAVQRSHWEGVRALAQQTADAYALGIHPLYVPQAHDDDLQALAEQLERSRDDPRLVAVGEIGLDFFVPELCTPQARERQWHFYTAQLRMARDRGLPVILHLRRSADELLKGLRQQPVPGGIVHAFNGSLQQAQAFTERGFALGFGGALSFERALQLRRLARELPLQALVVETDAPDIPPQWLYRRAEEREAGQAQGRNSPAELPRIAQVLAGLRELPGPQLAAATTQNACRVLPRLQALCPALSA